jgi:uncharacterized protein YdeI (YjbR/CyaY-like superfamily)
MPLAPPVPPKPVAFANAAAFRRWLRQHHATATELLVRLFKVHASHQGLGYAGALDEALCYGWIDGIRRRLDDDSLSVRFTPRKRRSIWSRVNVGHVERLIASGRMEPAGLAAYQARTDDRTGMYSFERQGVELTPAFARKLRANAAAWRQFSGEPPWYQRLATYWVMSAKQETTRDRRLGILIASAAEGLRIPSQRERAAK